MAIDKVVSASITDGTITSSDLASGTIENQSAFKNIIINGDMSLAQRATSVTSISSGNTIHTCDRWKTYASSAGTWTQTQEALTTGDPYTNGFATSLKLDCTTANGSLSSGSYLSVAQSIEAQNLQYIKKGTANAEQLTASFWVKSTKTGTNIVQFVSLDDTVRICAQSYTISSSDTWEKKTITIPADTSSTGNISNDNGEGLRMIFWVVAGTDYTSGTLATTWADSANANRAVGQINNADSTSNNFEITGVQLEVGTSASDFEHIPFDINGFRCCRYYQKVGLNMPQYRFMPSISTNWSGAAQLGQLTINFPMRANPTTITSGSWTGTGKDATDNNCVPGSLTEIDGDGGFSTMHRFSWNANQNSASLGIGAQYYTNGDTPDLAFDAEL
jgi:hypothetical protein